jgi:hypothetical protein
MDEAITEHAIAHTLVVHGIIAEAMRCYAVEMTGEAGWRRECFEWEAYAIMGCLAASGYRVVRTPCAQQPQPSTITNSERNAGTKGNEQ